MERKGGVLDLRDSTSIQYRLAEILQDLGQGPMESLRHETILSDLGIVDMLAIALADAVRDEFGIVINEISNLRTVGDWITHLESRKDEFRPPPVDIFRSTD